MEMLNSWWGGGSAKPKEEEAKSTDDDSPVVVEVENNKDTQSTETSGDVVVNVNEQKDDKSQIEGEQEKTAEGHVHDPSTEAAIMAAKEWGSKLVAFFCSS